MFQGSYSCGCHGRSSSLIGASGAGWEGTALLHHGSYIKLGCMQFVFSIVEKATRAPCITDPVNDLCPPSTTTHYPQASSAGLSDVLVDGDIYIS